MKRVLLAGLALTWSVYTFGQLSFGGEPLSYSGKALNNDKDVQSIVMPGYDQAAVDAENELRDKNGELSLFAYPYATNYSLNNSGTWTELPNGDRVWKIKIEAPGALGMNFLYSDFFMPEGARFYVYTEDRTEFLGAFTEANNHESMEFATGNLSGDAMFIEYYEPKDVQGQGSMTISQVAHAYRWFDSSTGELRGSDPCQVDVNCTPEGDNWQDEKRGVCRILVNGTGLCSGSLITNTNMDCAPYVLFAQHCWNSGSPGNTSNTSVCYFNYERTGCGSGSSSLSNSLTGFIVRAASQDGGGSNGSDFLLVELTAAGAVSTLQGWNCYWNGWDANNTASSAGVSIHHPSGDRKKISTYTSTLTTAGWGIPNTHWRVVWSATPNGHGVTEGGSSGSPIFNSAGRIVGQLTGGSSYCTATSSPDLYGKMSYNWNSNPGAQTLEMWLDPGSTGIMAMDGTYWPCSPPASDDAGITAINEPTGTICSATFTPEVVLRNYGGNTLTSVDILYDVDGGPTQTYSWTGSLATAATTTVTLPSMTTTAGAHTFNAWTDQPNGNADGNTSNDADAQAFTVVVGGNAVDFTLTTDCWGSEVTWEVVQGATQFYSGGPYTDIAGGETITESWCLADGCYDFIIYDSYGDGMYGSQWGTCSVDGSYSIDQGASNLASILAANSDYGTQETNNFCVCTPLTVNITGQTNVSCNGGSDGTATASASGGTGPYNYQWSPSGGMAATATGLSAGTYTVNVTDASGCPGTANVTITEPTAVTGSITGTTPSDCLGATGTATAAGAGGTPGYTYQWDAAAGSQTTATAVGLAAGTYTVTITDANGCTTNAVATVTAAGAPTGSTSSAAETCAGDCDGTATATGSGGSGSYTYQWDAAAGSQTTATATGLCAGTYDVVITDGAGCASAPISVTVAPGLPYPTAGFTYSPTPVCAGEVVTFTNTTTPSSSYAWDFGDGNNSTATNPTNTFATQGSYTVTLDADNGGCMDQTTMVIDVNCTVGIDELGLGDAINVYPNPSEGMFNIEIVSEFNEDIVVEISNSIGQLIETFTVQGDNLVPVDMTNQAEGIYYVTFKSEGSVASKKVSIVR